VVKGDRFVSRHISAALKVPKNTVASIFLNGRSFEPPRLFLELTPIQLNNRGRRALVRVVTKTPMVTLTELQSSSVEMGELPARQPYLQQSTKQAFMVEWPDGSHSSVKST
jgi:hypothetical protein